MSCLKKRGGIENDKIGSRKVRRRGGKSESVSTIGVGVVVLLGMEDRRGPGSCGPMLLLPMYYKYL